MLLLGEQLFRLWKNIFIGCSIWCWFVVAFVNLVLQGVDVFCVKWKGLGAKFKLWMWGFVSTIETSTKAMSQLMSWELDAFHHYHVGVDICKCALSWRCTKEHKFPTMALLAWKILGIPMNQIKIEDSFNCWSSHCILVVSVANWSPLLDGFCQQKLA